MCVCLGMGQEFQQGWASGSDPNCSSNSTGAPGRTRPRVGWGQALDKTVQGGWVLFRGTRGAGGPECDWALRCVTEEGSLNLGIEGRVGVLRVRRDSSHSRQRPEV